MDFNIRMGIPEMQELWLDLQEKYRSGNIKKKEEQLYKKWGKALKLLSADPGYLSLQTHETEPLSTIGLSTSIYYKSSYIFL